MEWRTTRSQNFHAYTWCKPHSYFQVSDYSSCKQGSNFITIVNTPSPFPPVCPPGKVVRRPAWVNSSGAYWTSQSVSEFEVSWSATLSGQLVKSDERLEFRATVHVQKPNHSGTKLALAIRRVCRVIGRGRRRSAQARACCCVLVMPSMCAPRGCARSLLRQRNLFLDTLHTCVHREQFLWALW